MNRNKEKKRLEMDDTPEIIYEFTQKIFFGFAKVSFHVEDRKTFDPASRYKHFIVVRIGFKSYEWTIRSEHAYIGWHKNKNVIYFLSEGR